MHKAEDRPELLRQAVAHLAAGHPAQAAALCRVLLGREHGDAQALRLLGIAVALDGDLEQAAALLIRAARMQPRGQPHLDMADLLHGDNRAPLHDGDPQPPLAGAEPGGGIAFAARLRQTDRTQIGNAISGVGPAAPTPLTADTLNTLGLVMLGQGRIAEAAERFRRATDADPGHACAYANAGVALAMLGRVREALPCFRTALQLRPDDPHIHAGYGAALLKSGDFTAGWPEYRWRLRIGTGTTRAPVMPLDTLHTGARLDGRVVVVTQEDGTGDTIQTLRYVPMLAATGASVVLNVPPALVRLCSQLPGTHAIIPTGASLPHHDWRCAFLGLPEMFATTLATIPAAVPYLLADPPLRSHWGARLRTPAPAPDGIRRAGLAWAGASRGQSPAAVAADRRRSIPPSMLAPLAGLAGWRWISLQAGAPGTAATAPPPCLLLDDPMPAVRDFADTAAIIADLDIVVSIDTAVAHLAGAMGKPVLLLDRYDNDWRWLTGRSDSPWYPTLTILRQPKPGDWSSVIERLVANLRQMEQTAP